jgi:cell volume regulation protein A
MAALDAAHLGILLGSLLVLAGIMSSLVAMRFGAPLLLVFLIVGMLAGEAGSSSTTCTRRMSWARSRWR